MKKAAQHLHNRVEFHIPKQYVVLQLSDCGRYTVTEMKTDVSVSQTEIRISFLSVFIHSKFENCLMFLKQHYMSEVWSCVWVLTIPVTSFMTSIFFLSTLYMYNIFFCFHSRVCHSMCSRLNNRSFPRTRHRRKPISCNINRIILNQISQFSEAELQERVLSALKGSSASKGRENESDIEKSKRKKCTFISSQEYDAAHFANWLQRPQFCSISAATRPSLW